MSHCVLFIDKVWTWQHLCNRLLYVCCVLYRLSWWCSEDCGAGLQAQCVFDTIWRWALDPEDTVVKQLICSFFFLFTLIKSVFLSVRWYECVQCSRVPPRGNSIHCVFRHLSDGGHKTYIVTTHIHIMATEFGLKLIWSHVQTWWSLACCLWGLYANTDLCSVLRLALSSLLRSRSSLLTHSLSLSCWPMSEVMRLGGWDMKAADARSGWFMSSVRWLMAKSGAHAESIPYREQHLTLAGNCGIGP